jgi:tetratricopeptide (TPR) repeat protein
VLAVFVQGKTGDPAIQTAVEERILTEVRRVNSGGYPGPVLAWQLHLRAVTDAAQARGDEWAAALCNSLGYHLDMLGYHLDMLGDYARARPYLERALAIYEQVLGAEHPNTATSLNNLGVLLQAQGDLAGALPYYERALMIREQVLGTEHPDTATSLNNLGYLLRAQGDLAGARSYYERALRMFRAALGEQHPLTQTVQNNLEALLAKGEGPHGQTEGAP